MNLCGLPSTIDFLHLLYFMLLVGGVASCWVLSEKGTFFLGLSAAALGVWLKHIHLEGALSLILMAGLVFMFYRFKEGFFIKQGLFVIVALLGYLFYEHMIPGFQNFIWVENVHLSQHSTAYRMYINADKVLVGLMFLTAMRPLNRTFKDWAKTLKVLPFPFLWVAGVLLGTAFLAHYIRFDFKMPPLLWWWIPANLFLVCAMEEIFFRGFIQNQLSHFLSAFSGGKWISLGLASVLFGLYHHGGGPVYILLSTLAGLGYGYVYLKSQRIESAIALHFAVNLVHILAFSYPALMQ